MSINEIWNQIIDFPDYMVSNTGRIKRLRKEINYGNYKKISDERILTNKKHPTGYSTVMLSKGSKKVGFLVHRLVAEVFIPNPENKPQVNHKNGIRNDNVLNNLEWVTVTENHIHAFRVLNKKHPRHQFGKTGYLSKISKEIYCPTLDVFFGSIKQAARDLGLSSGNIGRVIKGQYKQTGGFYFRLPIKN